MATWANSPRIRARARARVARGEPPCWLCGAPIDYTLITPNPMAYELDHVKPVDKFPELAFTPSNWRPSHRQCNRAKWNNEFAPIIKRSGALL